VTPTRRRVLTLAAGAALGATLSPRLPAADDEREMHGISAFGDLKYPASFPHFDYVDPKAPKGGIFSHIGSTRQFNQSFLTFNSLNSYILRGDAAQGMELTFASLMVRAEDEPDAMYGLAARAVRVSGDGLTYRFLLRPEAKFHDGTKLTAQDVAFSLNILKEKGHPIITQLLRDFLGAEATDDATVVARFKEKRARDVPLFVAGLPIFSRAYYFKQPFDQSTLEIPLGSGAYKVGRFEPGRFIEYERVRDWWGEQLPVSVGQSNFDIVRYEYFRDREVGFEAFTAKAYLFREEFTSRTWATRYDFPAFRDGRVKREVLPDDTPSGAQGWFINTRRDKFMDPRLREALVYAFDFEWTNKTIMYGSYDRTQSVFQNSDMMAEGKPSEAELKLLEPFRGQVPDEVFGEPFVPPVSDGSGQDRRLLRHASRAHCNRVPDRGADLPAAPYAVHQEFGCARPRRHAAHRRPRAIPRARRRFRFRYHRAALQLLDHAGRFAAHVFLLACCENQGVAESRRHRQSGHRCADRHDHCRAGPPDARHRLPCARSRDPGRTLLDSALVQGVALDRLLGCVCAPRRAEAALCPWHPGNLVV
jgi:microcin C transport system substrate-binding protein